MKPDSFGTRLKSARIDAGYTQTYVAELLGLSQSVIARYENDIREPDLTTLKRLADFYSVSTDWLLGTIGKNIIVK